MAKKRARNTCAFRAQFSTNNAQRQALKDRAKRQELFKRRGENKK